MSTVLDLIKGSLELCGVLASGETPSAADASLGLRSLNGMLDSWSTENLALYSLPREVFELVPDQGSYTIGKVDGSDFDTLRPMTIKGAAVGELTKTPIYGPVPEPTIEEPDPVAPLLGYDLKVSTEISLEVLNYQKWIALTQKAMTSALPTYVYAEGTAQNQTLHFWPVPNRQIGFVLYSQKALGPFEATSDEIDLPPGYLEALEYNLAVRLSPRFGKQLDPIVVNEATLLKGNLKIKNSRTPLLVSDVCTVKPFNLISGD